MDEIELSNGVVIFMTTESNINNAKKLSNYLLVERSAACINFIDINSSFWWNGKIQESKEVQMLIKTTEENSKRTLSTIKRMHSYENPEIIILPVQASKKFQKWVAKVLDN